MTHSRPIVLDVSYITATKQQHVPTTKQRPTGFTVISRESSKADTGITIDTIYAGSAITTRVINTVVYVYKGTNADEGGL